MERPFVWMLILLAWLPAAGAAEKVVSRSPKLQLTQADWLEVVRILSPQARRHLLAKRANLLDFVLDVHSDEALARRAEAEGIAQDPLVRARLAKARRDILAAAYMDRVVAGIDYPDFERLSYQRYEADKAKFKLPQKRKVAHILIRKPRPDCPCDTRDPNKIAAELQDKLKQGAEFADLAREYSDDKATAAKGGVLELWIEPEDDRLVPQFSRAVFALAKPGEVSAPVETRFGLHLIQLLEVQPARQLGYDEVRDKILHQLRAEYRDSRLQELRSDTYPDPDTIDFAALEALLGQGDAEQEAAP